MNAQSLRGWLVRWVRRIRGLLISQRPKRFWALYRPEDGETRRIQIERELGGLCSALEKCEEGMPVVIVTADERELEQFLTGDKLLRLGSWSRQWVPLGRQGLQELGVVFGSSRRYGAVVKSR